MTTADETRRYLSPLRYPGGKARMSAHLGEVFARQAGPLDLEIWIEPFAGGAGVGLRLLDEGKVSEFWLVERHPALAAFWRTAVERGEELAAAVERLTVDMDLWHQSRAIVAAASDQTPTDRAVSGHGLDDLSVATAAFVVNRCSRSGIVTPAAGPIGGKNQRGRWHVGSRWNGPALAERIRYVRSLAPGIRFIEGDGIAHIEALDGTTGIEDEVFLFVDPPYLREGNRLYANGMSEADHARLARALRSSTARWVLTYDDEPVVHEHLYPHERVLAYEIANTANRQRIATEYAVLSDNCDVAEDQRFFDRGQVTWIRDTPITGQTHPAA